MAVALVVSGQVRGFHKIILWRLLTFGAFAFSAPETAHTFLCMTAFPTGVVDYLYLETDKLDLGRLGDHSPKLWISTREVESA